MLDFGASVTGDGNPDWRIGSSEFRANPTEDRSNLCGKGGRDKEEREMVDWRRGVGTRAADGESVPESGSSVGENVGVDGAGGAAAAAAFSAASASAALIRFCSRRRSRLRTVIARFWGRG